MSTIATALLAAVWYWLGGSFIGYTIYPIVISPTVIGMVFEFILVWLMPEEICRLTECLQV